MRDHQENQLTMFNTVASVCELNMALITPVTALNDAYIAFKNECELLNNISQEQLLKIEGVTHDKNLFKADLAVHLSIVSKLLKAFAIASNNSILYDEVNYPESTFARMRDVMLQQVAQIIQERASTLSAELLTYGYTATMKADLDTALDKYQQKVANPTVAKDKRVGATAALAEHIRATTSILKLRLDNSMQVLRQTEPKFYTLYFNARKIINLRGKVAQNKGTLTGFVRAYETNQAIFEALIEVIDSEWVSSTNVLGHYALPLAPNTYAIRVSHEDYEEVILENIVITKGAETALNVTMTPLV